MFRLQTSVASLLVVTLATGSALASPYEFQRHEVGNRFRSGGPLSVRLGHATNHYHAFDNLEAREPGAGAAALGKLGPKAVTFAKNHVGDIASVVGLGLALKPAPKPKNQPQRRGLEFDEDLVVRDLDAEELFGREYDLLDERDITIDDLD